MQLSASPPLLRERTAADIPTTDTSILQIKRLKLCASRRESEPAAN